MERRSPPGKPAPKGRGKGEIKQEGTGSSPQKPPPDDSEPPPLEDVSEPHSKASSPRHSIPLSEDLEKGFSPPSSYSKKGNSSLSSSERVLSPSPQRARSPSHSVEEVQSPATYADEVSSPASHPDSQKAEKPQSNSTSVQNEPSSPRAEANNFNHTRPKTMAANADASTAQNADVKSSLRTSIPALTQTVASAVKHVSFRSSSLSSKSSTAIYGRKPWWKIPKSWWKNPPRHMKMVEAAFRIGGAVLALIAFSLMCATSEWRQGAGSTFKMSFRDYPAYNYLVALNIISFVYSCWQAAAVFRAQIGDVFDTARENMLFTYVCDQILAFLLFSASTAAATAAQLSRHGLHNVWPSACATWSLWRFCAQADAAVAMSFLSSFFVISSSVYSGYNVSHSFLE